MKTPPPARWLLLIWFLAALACAGPFSPANPTATPPPPGTPTEPGQAAAPSRTPAADAATPTAPAAGDFAATALSPVSVALAWLPVAEAAGYQIQARYGEGELFVVADLAADQTSYMHFVLPGSAQLTYQLSALSGGGQTAEASATVALPVLEPQPLVVQPLAATPTVGEVPEVPPLPTIDPLNPDPDALATVTAFLEGFDPEALAPPARPVSSWQDIGPEGGVITLTAPNAARFTLEIPAGAVDELTTFFLTPIGEIVDAPVAAELLAAVQIFPPLRFREPLTLTIIPSANAAAAPVTIGFSVSSLNSELALAPIYPVADGYRLAVYWGDTFGLAATTLAEVEAQTEQIPSEAGDQLAQQLAALRAFSLELSPDGEAQILAQLVAGLLQRVEHPQAHVWPRRLAGWAAPALRPGAAAPRQARRGSLLMADIVMADRTFSEGLRPAQPGQPDLRLRRGQIITRLAGEIKLFLDEHAGCRTKDDYYAQALLHLLKAPASGFQRDLAVDYVTRYGPPTSHKTCDYQLHVITSRMVVRVEDEGGGLVETARVHTSPFPLQAVSRGGLAVLQGATAVIYDQLELLFTDCPAAFEVSPYPTPSLQITDLRPIYDADDRVSNFTLQGVALDPITTTNAGHLTLDVDEAGNCTVERFDTTQEPVDTWGALFSGLHNPHLHTDNWTIAGEESYVATSQVVGLQQGSVTETTTMVLTVNQTEP